MPRVCFVSDLHLFARRSRGGEFLEAIRTAATNSGACVFGGDIFDFRWSTLASPQVTLKASIQWLRELVRSVPGCQFHFVVGNHDDHPGLLAELPLLQSELPNFAWERFVLRLGDTVFLHGDVADRKMSHHRLSHRRESFRHHPRTLWQHRAYHLLVQTRVHQLIPRLVYPKRIVAKRILAYLRSIHLGPEQGVKQVCFGHTHRELDGFALGDVLFHNGGAPIGKSRFRVLELETGGSGFTTENTEITKI